MSELFDHEALNATLRAIVLTQKLRARYEADLEMLTHPSEAIPPARVPAISQGKKSGD
jgi:hypothetical protein